MSKKIEKIIIKGITYTVNHIIGNGGNADVYSATINNDDVNYAIKRLKTKDKKKIERFKKEIEFQKYSKHKNILKIIDWDEDNDGIYAVMPACTKSLRDAINENSIEENALNYINQLCQAIEYAHEKDVIHRDIKPENILLNENNLLLADFGIAHFVNSALTNKDELLCNRNYAAPEQKIKNNSLNITKATDIFALGAIINEIFTNKNPQGSEFVKISDKHPCLYKLDDLVHICMKQNPDERPEIKKILSKLNSIEGEIKEFLISTEDWLYQTVPSSIKVYDKVQQIVERASKDILIAKTLYESKSKDEMQNYNYNYHMDIHYSITKELKSIYFQQEIYNLCKSKFNYESNGSKEFLPQERLDLVKENDRKIYDEFKKIMRKYTVTNPDYDATNKVLKLILSCRHYHCREILCSIERLESNLHWCEDAPILYIIQKLIDSRENFEKMQNFKIDEYIEINWEKTIANNYIDDQSLIPIDNVLSIC